MESWARSLKMAKAQKTWGPNVTKIPEMATSRGKFGPSPHLIERGVNVDMILKMKISIYPHLLRVKVLPIFARREEKSKDQITCRIAICDVRWSQVRCY
jgi:hypothetical protein